MCSVASVSVEACSTWELLVCVVMSYNNDCVQGVVFFQRSRLNAFFEVKVSTMKYATL